MACYGDLSWQYVNSMSWIIVVGDGAIGVCCMLFGAPIMRRMFGLSLAWHWRGVCGHVHLSNHYGIVWSWDLLLILPALVDFRSGYFFWLVVFV